MARQNRLPASLPPRLIDRQSAAAYVNLSPNAFDRLIAEGKMPRPKRLTGRRKAWDVRALDAAVDNLRNADNDNNDNDDSWDDVDAA
jgi:predicted DNA-binding transcriptional regulator AlpA